MGTFIEQLKNEIIPHVEKMVEKEENHLKWLKSVAEKNRKSRFFDFDKAIRDFEFFLNHFKTRVEEYKEYIKDIS